MRKELVPSLLAVVALVDLLEPAVMPTARCCPLTVAPLPVGLGLVLVGVDTLSPPVTTLPAVGSGGAGGFIFLAVSVMALPLALVLS